jgi:hypothetical protein
VFSSDYHGTTAVTKLRGYAMAAFQDTRLPENARLILYSTMKKFVLSCLALGLTAVAAHSQSITRILPKTGYHHWEKVEFKTSLRGSAETRWGKEIITTTDGGKTWVKKIATGVESAESVPPIKKNTIGWPQGQLFPGSLAAWRYGLCGHNW